MNFAIVLGRVLRHGSHLTPLDSTASATAVPAVNIPARCTARPTIPTTGSSYRFDTVSGDGVRPWVRHVQVVNNWTDRSRATNASPSISLTAGQPVPITLEYGKEAGSAATPTIGLNAH